MRRTLIPFLLAEVLAITLYAWQAFAWYGWKAEGPDAFPGSPDAAYLYRTAEKGTVWFEGLVVGLLVGALAICIARQHGPEVKSRAELPLRWSVCLLPMAALAIVNAIFALQPVN